MEKLKVTNIFHWLYAGLMFAPIVSIGASVFYSSFNDNYGSHENIEYYKSNEVDNNGNGVISGNIYELDFKNKGDLEIYCSNVVLYGVRGQPMSYKIDDFSNDRYLTLFIRSSVNTWQVSISNYNTGNGANLNDIQHIYVVVDEHTQEQFYDLMSYTDFKLFKGINNEVKPVDLITSSYNQVWEERPFSWVKNSYVVEPFKALTSFFGVDQNNSINYFLAYWVTTTIIWLCFDVLMFVPNYIHKLIDRG